MTKSKSVPAFASRPFWTHFARGFWEKKPIAFHSIARSRTPNIFTSIDAVKVFSLLVKYSDLCRKRDSLDGLKFYVDGVRLESFEATEHLPVASDKSLEGYHRRMSEQFGDYGLVCDELLQVLDDKDPSRKILGEFMDGLFEFTGVPNRFSELGLYLGNYRKTPFGVHVDPCGVFSIPVVGRKTFRLWDPKYVEKNPELKEAFSYVDFLKKSILLEVAPGDLAYWPSSYWHIAESSGDFSCTWSIGVWVDRPLSDVVITALTPLVEKSLGRSGKRTSLKASHGSRGATKTLPPELKSAARAISKLTPAQIEKLLAKWWRDHTKRNAFK